MQITRPGFRYITQTECHKEEAHEGNVAFPCYFAPGHQIVSVVMYCCSKGEKVAQVKATLEAKTKKGDYLESSWST